MMSKTKAAERFDDQVCNYPPSEQVCFDPQVFSCVEVDDDDDSHIRNIIVFRSVDKCYDFVTLINVIY